MKTAHEKNRELAQSLGISVWDAQKLRRAQLTARRCASCKTDFFGARTRFAKIER